MKSTSCARELVSQQGDLVAKCSAPHSITTSMDLFINLSHSSSSVVSNIHLIFLCAAGSASHDPVTIHHCSFLVPFLLDSDHVTALVSVYVAFVREQLARAALLEMPWPTWPPLKTMCFCHINFENKRLICCPVCLSQRQLVVFELGRLGVLSNSMSDWTHNIKLE